MTPASARLPVRPETTAERFERLRLEWRKATGHLSSLDARMRHPAYREIAAIGKPVLPLLFASLASSDWDWWFEIICELTGENPCADGYPGSTRAVVDAFTALGRRLGYFR